MGVPGLPSRPAGRLSGRPAMLAVSALLVTAVLVAVLTLLPTAAAAGLLTAGSAGIAAVDDPGRGLRPVGRAHACAP